MFERLSSLARRYRNPLLGVGVLALAVAAILFGHMPIQAAKRDLISQIQQRRKTVAELRGLFARRDQLEVDLKQAQQALTDLQHQLEQQMIDSSFLTYLEENAVKAGVVVTALAFSAPEPIAEKVEDAKQPAPAGQGNQKGQPQAGAKTSSSGTQANRQGQQPASAKAAAPAGGQPASAKAAAPAGGNDPAAPYFRYPMTLVVIGEYPGLVKLAGRLEQVSPFARVDQVSITQNPDPPERAARPGSQDARTEKSPNPIPRGWARMELRMSVVAGRTSAVAQELVNPGRAEGRQNPFKPAFLP